MRKLFLFAVLLTLTIPTNLHAALIAFDELVDGDLSHITPRNIGTLDLGVNTIVGVLDNPAGQSPPPDPFDPGTFTLPTGLIIASVTIDVTDLSGTLEKAFILVDPADQQVAATVFDAAGTQDLNAAAFPLPTPGDYDFLVRNEGFLLAGESVSYQWTITTAVPIPPTGFLTIPAVLALASRRHGFRLPKRRP